MFLLAGENLARERNFRKEKGNLHVGFKDARNFTREASRTMEMTVSLCTCDKLGNEPRKSAETTSYVQTTDQKHPYYKHFLLWRKT